MTRPDATPLTAGPARRRVTGAHSGVVLPRHLADVWRYRELLRSLTVRNLKVKYQRSLLGFIWTVVNPLFTVTVLVTVFSHVVRIALPHYWAFLLSGYFVWNFVIQTLNMGTYVLAAHARLTRGVAFPVELLVFGAGASKLIEFLAEITLILIALVALHHHSVPASFVLLPVLIAIQLLLVLGLALPVATLSVFYYDVQHALPIALTTLFYLSPVFYPASMVPDTFRSLYMLNPIASLLTLFQTILYEGRFPDPGLLAATAAAALLIFWAGYAIFHRYARVIPEVV
jgi:ABC-type polysaccharide/polyol phosphate export permease